MHAVIKIIFYIDHIKNAYNWVAAILDMQISKCNVISGYGSVSLVGETEFLEKTTSLSQVTDKLYNIMFYRPTANITDVKIQWKNPQKRWDDRHLEIDSEGRLRTKLYAKRDDFDFPIVNLPFTCICRKNSSSICIWYVYLSDDTTSVLVLRKATTSNLTIHGLIQPTTEPMINHVNHNIPDADNIYFLFQLQFKYSSA